MTPATSDRRAFAAVVVSGLSLFLPRIALLVAWLQGTSWRPFICMGLLPLLIGLLLPRVLVLYLIYLDQGISLWFIIHLVVALMVWGGSGRISHTATQAAGTTTSCGLGSTEMCAQSLARYP